MARIPSDSDRLWPLRELHDRLGDKDLLAQLCGPESSRSALNVREVSLEDLARQIVEERFGRAAVRIRRPLAETLGLERNTLLTLTMTPSSRRCAPG